MHDALKSALWSRSTSVGWAIGLLLMAPSHACAADESSPPPKLAVFEFELDDFGAAASIVGEAPGDRYNLMLATDEAIRRIAGSGQFRPVSVDPAHGIVIRDRSLRLCNGCEAEVARQLGADQSLLVVFTRLSMTDYTMSYQLRDTASGRLLTSGTTDLRMGASYSWARGAAWLVNNRILNAGLR